MDDSSPSGGLVEAIDGGLYGTTANGGAYERGTVFKITPGGTLTTLYSFCPLGHGRCTDGEKPYAGLVQAANGDFYGTTPYGGATCISTGASGGCGTVFRINRSGTLTTIYQFCAQTDRADGEYPVELVQATDGSLYGTTYAGGANGAGTIFKITPSGTLATLYSFYGTGGSGGPEAGLVQATNGDFYGTTSTYNNGTVFSLSVGLAPFVKTQPHFGTVGAAIRVLGTDLTGATSVTFNGTPAAFEVVSPTEIAATVPAGATTGSIQVTTPGGTLASGGPFLVAP